MISVMLTFLLGAPSAMAEDTSPQPTARCRDGEITLNFVEANLVDVVRFVSETTGRRFILSNVPGATTVTVFSPTPVCRREIYEVFLAILAQNNLAVVRHGRFHVITSAADAVRGPIPVVTD
jgi:type II secretory pathway component GspD/PulD (secretin)